MEQTDLKLDEAPSRFVIGIDLGTTNSAVMYVDTAQPQWQVRLFRVPQVVAPGEVELRETLPSFHYQAGSGELQEDALRLPWSRSAAEWVVGALARDHGKLVPGRQVASAKSWLCHSGVDRTAELLPWHATADCDKLSPVAVSARYLQHIRAAWDHAFPDAPLSAQDLVLTLPASFDEVARELTVEAAAQAGLPRVVLIEEPQAAFYAWLYLHRDDWRQHVSANETILVCDIGGGTTDFTLIRVRRAGESEATAQQSDHAIQFHRVAVGDHLILGGDNLDLALARSIEARLTAEGKLEPRQWDVLVGLCRDVKETLLDKDAPRQWTVHLPGSGSRLIGGGAQAEVEREAVRQLLVDGFFPPVALSDRPARHQSGFQEFGLPYATDPAITRHLAAFLTAHRQLVAETSDGVLEHDPARPDIVLFNGGMFAAPVVQERLLRVLSSWFSHNGDPDWAPRVLQHDRLDLAVARGAAYFGMVRRGEGVRIAATLARSYYIGVDSDDGNDTASALCLVPGSAEPGDRIDLVDRQFRLLISQPVEFPLFVSSTRLADQPGEMIPVDREQLTPLPSIRTVLRIERRKRAESIDVQLHARLSEIGTLELWCGEVRGERSWRLQFDVRAATQTDVEAHESSAESEGFLDEASWGRCRELIERTFGADAPDQPEGLVKRLAESLQVARGHWPPSLLRRIWETLIELEPGRRRSAVHEARWLNTLGYALRPGYGFAVDDWRVGETWRTVQGKLAHATTACRNEALILWRRIAGGLTAGQQRSVAEPLRASVRALHQRSSAGQGGRGEATLSVQDSIEVWRLLGSLELLQAGQKVRLGDMLLELIPKHKWRKARAAMVWAVGRLGSRVPMYGPMNTVVPTATAHQWLKVLLATDLVGPPEQLATMQLARRTGDRYRDVSQRDRGAVCGWLERHAAPRHYVQLVEHGGQLDAAEQGRVFGEALPKGLRILT